MNFSPSKKSLIRRTQPPDHFPDQRPSNYDTSSNFKLTQSRVYTPSQICLCVRLFFVQLLLNPIKIIKLIQTSLKSDKSMQNYSYNYIDNFLGFRMIHSTNFIFLMANNIALFLLCLAGVYL